MEARCCVEDFNDLDKQPPRIGIIGGSGLYDIPGLTEVEEVEVETPYGGPSDTLIFGTLKGRKLVFLPRHGKKHTYTPSEVNYRANIYAMKLSGVRWIISVSATGSMKEEIAPGHFVVPDQFIDRTRGRVATFFDGGCVAHVPFADPVCESLADAIEKAAKKASGTKVHRGGAYLCMEGPQFSTRAESKLYRSWGVSVIGMTNLTEAKLAREAEICYATLALSTDYDCWHETEEDVAADAVLKTMKANIERAKRTIEQAVEFIPAEQKCSCASALKGSIVTDLEAVPVEAREKLALLLRKYLNKIEE